MDTFLNFQKINEEFKRQHPDISITAMLTAFSICNRKKAGSIQEAFKHIYGNGNGRPKCSWCQNWIERDKYR